MTGKQKADGMGWGRVLYLGGSRSKQMWFEECIGLVGVFLHAWLTLKEQLLIQVVLGFFSELGLLKKS